MAFLEYGPVDDESGEFKKVEKEKFEGNGAWILPWLEGWLKLKHENERVAVVIDLSGSGLTYGEDAVYHLVGEKPKYLLRARDEGTLELRLDDPADILWRRTEIGVWVVSRYGKRISKGRAVPFEVPQVGD